MDMRGFSTSYHGIFGASTGARGERTVVDSIEIPIIQRDYAQGRDDDETATIRRDFLDVLIHALKTNEPVSLDFVYGEVTDGVLKPLDGQQRLTTLFLLHWYIASRSGALDSEVLWARFRYATRLSAQYFCRELVSHRWPADDVDPVAWITDQPWYLFPWRTDPTIQSMLVMIGAIHDQFLDGESDFTDLWQRLTTADPAPISFLFMPIDDMYSGDDLYIKMNSRGKPLTEFEIFKSRLEKVLRDTGRQVELSEKLDREWSDLLWNYRGDNFLIDEEFMNYFAFIVDICEWRSGQSSQSRGLLERARNVFEAQDNAESNLDFLFFAFDTWVNMHTSEDMPSTVFATLFRIADTAADGLLLFESQEPNLFAACLAHYGTKQFSLAETLLLFAVLIYRQMCPEGTDETLAQRLRSLRNIVESAPDDVRTEYMPDLVASTITLMTQPDQRNLDGLARFNQARVDDEKYKRQWLRDHEAFRDEVAGLEDHDLLRGRLFAFALDPATIKPHGETFRTVTAPETLPLLSAALLTKGDYSRSIGGNRRQLGVMGRRRGSGSWREVLTSGSRSTREQLRSAMASLLDDVADARHVEHAGDILQTIVADWLAAQEESQRYSWRYYFVRYPVMLSAPRGTYVGEYDSERGGYGYRIDMLWGGDYRASFTDPYLLAAWTEVGEPNLVAKPEFRSWDYTGKEKAVRLVRSGAGVRTTETGFEILLPDDPTASTLVRSALEPFGLDSDYVIHVEQDASGKYPQDREDRVLKATRIVRALLSAGQ